MKEKLKGVTNLFSTAMEVVGFILLIAGVASFSIPISAIVGGVLLIIAGGLTA